jgi:hypothetical protein
MPGQGRFDQAGRVLIWRTREASQTSPVPRRKSAPFSNAPVSGVAIAITTARRMNRFVAQSL